MGKILTLGKIHYLTSKKLKELLPLERKPNVLCKEIFTMWRLSQGRESPLRPILSDSISRWGRLQGTLHPYGRGCWGGSWRDHLHLHLLGSCQEYGTVVLTHPAWKKMLHRRWRWTGHSTQKNHEQCLYLSTQDPIRLRLTAQAQAQAQAHP